MRNVTISLDEETARWTRVEAARHDLSVSRFVGELLRSEMEAERRLDEAAASYRSRPARALKAADDRYPDRDAVHAR